VIAAARPLVDDGELRGVAALLRELEPRPGRLADTLRLVVLVLAAVTISEVFRLPEPAVSAYVILFVSRGERASTVKTAIVAGIAVCLGVLVTIVVFMASLSEPALRVPLIAVITFAAMVLARSSPLGPAAFAAGFIIAYGLTIGDQVLGLSLQSSAVSNTTEAGIPELFSIPPEEALLHFLLWLTVVVSMPVGLVVLSNLLSGRRPVALLRAGLASRLDACARFCAGEPGAEQSLLAVTRTGSAELGALSKLSGQAAGQADFTTLVRESQRLSLALLAWPAIATASERGRALQPCAVSLRAAERCVRLGGAVDLAAAMMPMATGVPLQPLAVEVARAWAAIVQALNPAAPAGVHGEKAPTPLISHEALRDPATIQFALKVTLAVMLSYAAESLLDWPAIHTCVVTCFFVSLGTVGESVHKAVLRVTGAIIGGALGIATILLLMPVMTNLGDLLLAIAAVTLLAGWVACGSERISYAGWQIGLAYYLTVLQGYGPTLDMQTARDRVIGVVLGNIIVMVVFTTLWPVSVAGSVRRHVATAIGQLAAVMRLEQQAPGEAAVARTALQAKFAAATTGARGLLANTAYEAGAFGQSATRRPIDDHTIADLDSIMLVLSVILNLQAGAVWADIAPADRQAVLAYHEAMADWFDRCAQWIGAGGGQGPEAIIPHPPTTAGTPTLTARSAWYGVLDARLHAIMSEIAQRDGVIDSGGGRL
jgi:multidrug resistance protein MdtO